MRRKLAADDGESEPSLAPYLIFGRPGASKEHEVTRIVRLLGCILFACVLVGARAPAVSAEEPANLAAPLPDFDPATVPPDVLAERYFDEAQRFDAFLTYEVTHGPARAVFTVARRWRDGLAELIFDVREPHDFEKWAALLRQTRGGSDDLFLYAGSASDRRVRRLAAPQVERHAFFDMLAIGDYRPTARGELDYAEGADELQGNVPCRVVVATTPSPILGFDRVELAFSKSAGLLLEERFFSGPREIRRLTSKPEDFREVEGRRIPFRRVARTWPDTGPTEIVLLHQLETADLPDDLFSSLNLKKQHFPEF